LTTQVAPGFIATVLNWETIRRHADTVALGNAQKTVTLGELSAFPFPRPPIAEQVEIVSRMRSIQEELAFESRSVEKLRCTKAGLMNDLLSGRVRVTRLLER